MTPNWSKFLWIFDDDELLFWAKLLYLGEEFFAGWIDFRVEGSLPEILVKVEL